ncbi:MAG TPA: twin-arginine translocase TatA/TatE family subunit [Solirubrobacteraceae bacterium]|nr:twin-arginine translocase TatA/TatE family subunit [Solirubrobacteraceae bacterium]
MGLDNPVHLLFVAVVALIFLGPKRLPELTRAAGKGIREFRESLNGEELVQEPQAQQPPPHQLPPATPGQER